MNDGVEDDVRDEQVDGLGRKLCFVQVNRQKDGGDANPEGRVANEPVSPVELKTDPVSLHQVWSQTQFNSVDFSQSRISVNK